MKPQSTTPQPEAPAPKKIDIICYPEGNIIKVTSDQLKELMDNGLVFYDDEWTEEKPNGQYGFNQENEDEIMKLIGSPAPTTKQIKKDVTYAYNEHGQSSAFDVANSYGVGYEYCKGCETDSPSIEHECLICGQTTAPAPISREVEGFTPGSELPEQIFFEGGLIVDKLSNGADTGNNIALCCYDNVVTPAELVNRYNQHPTLYRENQQLKERVKDLEDAAIIDMAFNPLKEQNQQQAKDIELLREALGIILANFKANQTFGTLPNKQEVDAGINIMSKALKQTEPKQ